MPAIDIPFPRTNYPGLNAGEGHGRLINAYCEVNGEYLTWRATPGSRLFADVNTADEHRGMIVSSGQLYVIYGHNVWRIDENGNKYLLSGSILGSGPVTIAQNNAAPVRDIVAVTVDQGAYVITSTTVTSLSAGSLPFPNSVCSIDGYFMYTMGDARIFASELNDKDINPLSFTTANFQPDGLIRGTTSGGQFYAWGPASCEVYQNVGTVPFPLARSSVIQVGLYGRWAIAGYEPGFNDDQVFVASDGTVRRLVGYDPQVISTKDLDRLIQEVTDRSTISCTAYVFDGTKMISVSSPNWTWEYNMSTGFWHERKTHGQTKWFGVNSISFNDRWIVSRSGSGRLLWIDSTSQTDDGLQIPMTVQSGPIKNFPYRSRVDAVFLDFTTGDAPLGGSADAVDPSVSISWSKDGGETWSNDISVRSLGKQGKYSQQVRVNRLGLSSHNGMIIRFLTSSPVYRTFRGGRAEYNQAGPA